jgi:hypothetical protein
MGKYTQSYGRSTLAERPAFSARKAPSYELSIRRPVTLAQGEGQPTDPREYWSKIHKALKCAHPDGGKRGFYKYRPVRPEDIVVDQVDTTLINEVLRSLPVRGRERRVEKAVARLHGAIRDELKLDKIPPQIPVTFRGVSKVIPVESSSSRRGRPDNSFVAIPEGFSWNLRGGQKAAHPIKSLAASFYGSAEAISSVKGFGHLEPQSLKIEPAAVIFKREGTVTGGEIAQVNRGLTTSLAETEDPLMPLDVVLGDPFITVTKIHHGEKTDLLTFCARVAETPQLGLVV